jgi:hypothetical protein
MIQTTKKLLVGILLTLLALTKVSNAQSLLLSNLNRTNYDDSPIGCIELQNEQLIVAIINQNPDSKFSLPTNLYKLSKEGTIQKKLIIEKTLNKGYYALQSILQHGNDSIILAGLCITDTSSDLVFNNLVIVIADTAFTGYRTIIIPVPYQKEFNINKFFKLKKYKESYYGVAIALTPGDGEFEKGISSNLYFELNPQLSSFSKLMFDTGYNKTYTGTDIEKINDSSYLITKGRSYIEGTSGGWLPYLYKLDYNLKKVDSNVIIIKGTSLFDRLFFNIFNPVKVLTYNKYVVVGNKTIDTTRLFIQVFDSNLVSYKLYSFDSSRNYYFNSFQDGGIVPAFQNAIHVNENGEILIGYTKDAITATNRQVCSSNLCVLKIDSNFNELWRKQIRHGLSNAVIDVRYTKDGGCILTASEGVPQNGDSFDLKLDVLVYKINKNGTITGVTSLLNDKNKKEVIAYPNPMQDEVSFRGLGVMQTQLIIYSDQGTEYNRAIIESETAVDVSRMKVGNYYYNIIDKNGEIIYAGKLIKR